MTDPTNPGGWPDAEAPGVPLYRGDARLHVMQVARSKQSPFLAQWTGLAWLHYGKAYPPAQVAPEWTYIAPVLTPAEIAAQVAAARAEEREAADRREDRQYMLGFLQADREWSSCVSESLTITEENLRRRHASAAAIRARGTP